MKVKLNSDRRISELHNDFGVRKLQKDTVAVVSQSVGTELINKGWAEKVEEEV